jgi:hypothetical protein
MLESESEGRRSPLLSAWLFAYQTLGAISESPPKPDSILLDGLWNIAFVGCKAPCFYVMCLGFLYCVAGVFKDNLACKRAVPGIILAECSLIFKCRARIVGIHHASTMLLAWLPSPLKENSAHGRQVPRTLNKPAWRLGFPRIDLNYSLPAPCSFIAASSLVNILATLRQGGLVISLQRDPNAG